MKKNLHNNKTKLIARAMLLVLLLTSAVNFTACGNKGLESGFDRKGQLPQFLCAYKSNKREFDINDVTLTFYYGGHYWNYSQNGTKLDCSEGLECLSFELRFENDKGDVHLIKKVEENFISDKYNITYESKIYNFLLFAYVDTILTYSHKEEIEIPKELFVEESGCIVFGIYSDEYVYIYDREHIEETMDCDFYQIAAISIFYKKVGDKIILSPEEL